MNSNPPFNPPLNPSTIPSYLPQTSFRSDILAFAHEHYQTSPDYPWRSLPKYAVLRHSDTKKWYAVIMEISKDRLGLPGHDLIDILNLKCDPVLSGSLRLKPGFLPAYHMQRGNWITILLDGTVDKETIFSLLEMSYDLTASRKKTRAAGPAGNREWLVPANPKYYDMEKAFSENEVIRWKQSSSIAVGDTVFMYVAAPVSAILYKCRAVEVDIPCSYDDGKVRMTRAMRIKLLQTYDRQRFSLKRLKDYGVYSVRGPRSVPNSLSCELNLA